MTKLEDPQRLLESSEFGDVLRAVKEETIAPERLEASAQVVTEKIAALAEGASAVSLASTVAGLTKGKLLLLTVTLAAGAVTAIALLQEEDRTPPAVTEKEAPVEPPPPPVYLGPEPPPLQVGSANASGFDGVRSSTAHGVERDLRREPRPSLPRTRESRRTTQLVHGNDENGAIVREAEKKKHQRPAIESKQPPAVLPYEQKRSSTLAAQLAALEAARQAARRGALDDAIKQLDALERAHPESQLLPEIVLHRARYRARAGRAREAIVDLERAIKAPSLAGRRAVLLRFLGDLREKANDCDGAHRAYLEAIGLGLDRDELAAAQRGIAACKKATP